NGNATPVRILSNFSAPVALALQGGDLYVTDNFMINVFDATAVGNPTPKRTLPVMGPTAASTSNFQLALDATGHLYVPVEALSVPTAVNTGSNFHARPHKPAPPFLRGGGPKLTAAPGIAVDPRGNIFAPTSDPAGPAIDVFGPGASGPAAPIRNVSGPTTG